MSKILLVEDDKSLREIYGVRLSAEGYEIVAAGDGEEALAIAVKERPDLIISDVMMPKISGFDMLDILRATPETKDLKVIMMTALSSDDQRQRGEALGANRYLVKSQVGIEDIVRAVHEVLADTPQAQPNPSADFGNVQAPVERSEESVPLGIASSPAEIEAAIAATPVVTEAPAPIVQVSAPVAPATTTDSVVPPTSPIASTLPPTPPVSTMPPAQVTQLAQVAPVAQPATAPAQQEISTLAPTPTPADPQNETTEQPQVISTLPPTGTPVQTSNYSVPASAYTPPQSTQLPSPTAPFSTPAPDSLREQAVVTPENTPPVIQAVPIESQQVATPVQPINPAPQQPEETVVPTPPQEPIATTPPIQGNPVTDQQQPMAPPLQNAQTTTPETATPTPQDPISAPFVPPQPLDHTTEPNYAELLSKELDDPTPANFPPSPTA